MKKISLLCFVFFSIIYNAQILYDHGAIGDDTSNFVLDGRKWNKSNLTFYFENLTSDIPNANTKNVINQAFMVWSNASNLTFTEVFTASNADIVIKWAVGNHGDGSNFDGTNGVLAHAFYPPPNSGDLAGDVHFDDDETWTDQITYNSSQPIDLMTVAIHEIGHALGLKHSQDPNAIMYAWYNGSRRELGIDDFNAIDTLYPKQISIAGLNNICNSSQENTYTLTQVPSNVTPVWSFSSNLIKNDESPNSIKVTPAPNSYGNAYVKVTLGTKEVIKNLWIGSPSVNVVAEKGTSFWDVYLTDPTNNNFETHGISSITWTKVSGNGVVNGNGFYAEINGSPTTNWSITIKISITNSCGTTEIIKKYRNPDPDHNPHTDNISIYNVYPNPTDNIINIELKDKKKDSKENVYCELFDLSGQSKSRTKITDNKASLSVRGLNKGMYILKIHIDEKVESHHVIVK